MQFRDRERTITSITSFLSDLTEIDNLNSDIISYRSGRSSTIYSKDESKETKLEDYTLKRIIGKGAFGKVYLVEHIITGE